MAGAGIFCVVRPCCSCCRGSRPRANLQSIRCCEIRIGDFAKGLTDITVANTHNPSELRAQCIMILSNTHIHLRRFSVLRLEITAIVMLVAAFSIVMATNLPPQSLSGVAQASDSPLALPAVNGAAAARDTLFLMPAVEREPRTP